MGQEQVSMFSIVERKEPNLRHYAFRVAASEIVGAIDKLHSLGIQVVPGWTGAGTEEPIVFPWLPAASVFFNDPAGNRVEFLAMLPEAPRPDIAAPYVTLSEWKRLHGHVSTTNMEQAAHFYEEVLGIPCFDATDPRGSRFLFVGGPGRRNMLGLRPVPAEKMEPRHFAFGVTPDVFSHAVAWLKAKGIAVHNHTRSGEEPEVHTWMPAVTIYFWDPDDAWARPVESKRPTQFGLAWALPFVIALS